jgi:uncharacterized protein YndB with AHSA1/START domain
MTVTNVHKDAEAMTMTITAEFDAPIEPVWQMWEDPRRLERWWGPPTFPATVVDHDLTPGGVTNYFMTGPDGEQPRGWWRVREVSAPHHLEFEDGFADDAGNPVADMPTMIIRATLDEQSDGGTRMTIETTFPSLEAMEQMLEMGMEIGMSLAVGQIDDLLKAEVGAP